MNLIGETQPGLDQRGRDFLRAVGWGGADGELLTGDASARQYTRLRQGTRSAVLMDASQNLESVGPFMQVAHHLEQLGFSAPRILARDAGMGLLLLEDFGDDTFTRLLGAPASAPASSRPLKLAGADAGASRADELYELATDVLVALHQHPRAIPANWRVYSPEKMLADLELYLEWRGPTLGPGAREEFRAAWRAVLPSAHRAPHSLLLRDYHAANLMLLRERAGIRRAGLLDFQDAYQGPVTYDLVSLVEDARRDLPAGLRERMVARYCAHFPGLDSQVFETSLAILAAQRHLRVLGIFERLSRRDGKHEYKRAHSARVERMLRRALGHPSLAEVRAWLARHEHQD